ncbi:MAG: GrpB family protein [Pseudomonadota bacterium]
MVSFTPEPIIICDYDPAWAEEFQTVGRLIRQSLGDIAERIDHIGSTSIPRLAAKPIVDIQISVRSLEPMYYREPLESLSFVWKSDNPQRTKRYFRESPGNKRTHIHVRKLGSWHQQFPLLFRDYLRISEADRALYASTKRQMAEKFRDDRFAYVEAKDPVIWEIMKRADVWAAESEWEPGPSDL